MGAVGVVQRACSSRPIPHADGHEALEAAA